jgi:ABC-type multidrug transport system ATPase subunit
MSHKLEVDSVQLQFGNKRILSDIYFKCETGKITGLLGSNGVGKSSLMKITYGTLKAEKSVRIDNIPQNEAFKSPDTLRYLPQFHYIPTSFSLKNIFRDFDLDYLAFTNTFPEFSTKNTYRMGVLAGGERRLIELYVIVKSSSLFVILDEPFTHLNPLQVEQVKKLLVAEKANKGILVSDHLYQHVIDICDDLYVLTTDKMYLTNSIQDLEKLGYAKLDTNY